jgi:hypothetical protein
MAKKMSVELIDDIDGSEACESIRFSIDGGVYEIDLNAVHASEMRAAFEEYVKAGRRGSAIRAAAPISTGDRGGSRRRAADPHNAVVRAWAAEKGLACNTHGRIPEHILVLFNNMNKDRDRDTEHGEQ